MKLLNTAVAIAALGMLSACTTASIKATNVNTKVTGTLNAGFQEPIAEIVYNGKTYRGLWRESAASAEQRALASYPHRRHLINISADLLANDGGVLRCAGLTHALKGELTCKSGDDTLEVSMY
ncbi:MAG: hypothetical protein U1E84_03975 [Rhodoferax sp.]